jgi:ubiquinone/menaquinone biosynthesis C-methylase UbiE
MPQPFDQIAPSYDKMLRPFERWFLGRWRAETLHELPPDSTILELGAGTGSNFAYYPNCKQAVASEISCQMLKFAAEKTDAIQLIEADAQGLPFASGTFDAVFATLVFCSIADPAAAFAEVIRVLKPNGRLVLLEHVRPNGLLGHVFDALSAVTVAVIDDHFNRRTPRLAEAAGLKVLEVRSKAFGIVNLIVCRKEA